MKRILSVILTIAMLVSATPAVFADAAADEDNAVITEELKKDENSEVKSEEETKITEDEPEEPQDTAEPEETEEISTMSAENGIALFAENEENEVEYTYYGPNYKQIIEKGTLDNALAAIGGTSNSGKIKLLKDIAVKSTINVKLEELDGNNFTITRADGFTGEIVNHSSGTLKIHDITLDGEGKANIQSPLIVAEKGSGLATNLILNTVTLKNNYNAASNSKGGAIYADGAAIGQTTSNDPVFCESVTIENCSAVYGGAIYNSACDDAMYFLNSEFNGNKADTGSALYIDYGSESRSINLSGCSFTNNDFTDSDSNATAKTKKTVVYATSSQQLSGQILFVSGNTKFDNASGTVSDIMLDGKLAQLTSYCNFAAHNSSAMTAINNIGSSPIRVAVGTFVNGYTDQRVISLLEEFSATDLKNSFKLVAYNGQTLPDGYQFLRRGYKDSRYATVKKPSYARTLYNSKTANITSMKTPKKFKSATQNAIDIDTNMIVTEDAYDDYGMYGAATLACETEEYYVKAKANNAKISSISMQYAENYTNTITVNGTVIADGSEATLNISPDILSTVINSSIIDIKIYIEYEVLAQPITIENVTGGTITTTPTGSANAGDTVTLTYTADAGYKFDGWNVYKTDDPSTTVQVTDNSFKMPGYGVTVSAKFVKNTHDVTITKEGEGTVSISPETPVEVGTTVSVTATPDEHWELSSLTMNGTDITAAKSFTMPDSDVVIKAVFVKKKFNVNITNVTGGTIKLLYPANPIEWDTMVTINVQAEAHYEIDTVTVDGENVTDKLDEQGDYTFTMPANDVSISATFKKKKYRMTTSGDHATFTPADGEYEWGETVTFTAVPEKWYSIKNVSADDNTVNLEPVTGEENTYSFMMPTGNVTITAETVRPKFNVEFDSQGGSPVDPATVENGSTVEKPSVPVWAGRGFAGWYTDSACTKKYDFATEVTGDLKLYARWFLWGDVNNDGTVDSYDALLIRRCRAGLTDYSLIENRLAGFVNGFETGRNYPDSGDAVSIRRFRAGLINRYKVEDGAAGYEFDLENDTYIPKN